jgi:hypothetical protein
MMGWHDDGMACPRALVRPPGKCRLIAPGAQLHRKRQNRRDPTWSLSGIGHAVFQLVRAPIVSLGEE